MNPNQQQTRSAPTKTAKNDDMLLTVLAKGATSDSRKLLKKYGQADAKNYKDLEQKLANLYVHAEDKIELEKEMQAIHPHKAWILKYEPKKEKENPAIEHKTTEIKLGADGANFCPCCGKSVNERSSHFDAQQPQINVPQKHDYTPLYLISLVAIFGIISLKK